MKKEKTLIILYWILYTLSSCGNSSTFQNEYECLHISEVNFVDGITLHDGLPYTGVVYETFNDVFRDHYKYLSPIKINGLPDEFMGKIAYAMTIKNGNVNGPFASILNTKRIDFNGKMPTVSKEEEFLFTSFFVFELTDGETNNSGIDVRDKTGKKVAHIDFTRQGKALTIGQMSKLKVSIEDFSIHNSIDLHGSNMVGLVDFLSTIKYEYEFAPNDNDVTAQVLYSLSFYENLIYSAKKN